MRLTKYAVFGLFVLVFAAGSGDVLANTPFGVAVPERTAGAGSDGWWGSWLATIAAWQSAFYQDLIAALKAFRERPDAAFLLIGLSFAYGVFHAAGPGHGKVVISTYMLASGETLKRGILISCAASAAQAITAIVFIGIAAVLLNLTSIAITETTQVLELGSYALIILLGLWLLKQRGTVLLNRWRKPAHSHHHGHHDHEDHHHEHHHHDHGHDHDDHHHHHHAHDGHCSSCGHAHVAAPDQLTGPLTLKAALSAILAVGLRPCSGALIVLVFALRIDLFWIGALATFAMAAGTALTVSALSAFAVFMRDRALRLAGGTPGRMAIAADVVGVSGALLITALGVVLFLAAYQSGITF
ncbi:nickel/cobalt transporter [Coralliovum pocilloporae]|uniref:nickel/cobalt transporter n=1 Tax=Coralliovum pocilloporae TaxID=3066369 RepID=UPI003306EAF4